MTGSERFRREGEFKQQGLGENRTQVTAGGSGRDNGKCVGALVCVLWGLRA